MRLMLLIPLLVVWTACHAESPIVTDLKNLYRIRRDWQPSGLSIEDYRSRMDIIRSRARPIVTEEFAKLAGGEVSPLARELLTDREAMEFCWTVLLALFPTFTAEEQVMGVNAVFTATPESHKGYVVLTLLCRLPKAALSGTAIQKWTVDHINAGMHAGAFYFILTEDSAVAVSKAARNSMKRFSRRREDCRQNLFSLISAAFLASRNDEEALAFLGSLLDNRSIESTLDRMYVIPAAAMSGHRQLVQRIIDIAKTDKRIHWNGEDCVPRESSFAHAAANACSFVIEDFPSIGFWSEYDEAMKKKVVNWIGENHAYIVHGNPTAILRQTPFNEVVTGMLRQFDSEQSGSLQCHKYCASFFQNAHVAVKLRNDEVQNRKEDLWSVTPVLRTCTHGRGGKCLEWQGRGVVRRSQGSLFGMELMHFLCRRTRLECKSNFNKMP